MSEEQFPSAFFFQVSIDGQMSGPDMSFQDVSGIAMEMETENYSEGGENHFVYRLPKAIKYQNLVLSRGLAPSSSPLIQWCKDTLEKGLSLPIVTKPLKITLLSIRRSALDPDTDEVVPLRSWSFAGAYPVKWQAESFNSTKNEIAIEKIEFAYQGFIREADG